MALPSSSQQSPKRPAPSPVRTATTWRCSETEDAEPAAKRACTNGHEAATLQLNVIAALSGDTLASLQAPADWKVHDLASAVSLQLPPGVVVKKLILGEVALKSSEALGQTRLVTGSTVQAMVRATPALCLASPCSAAELSKRRGSWYVNTWGECGGGGTDTLVSGKVQHHDLEKAPAEARAVAMALQAAAPNLAERRVCLADHGLKGGEVIVIANAGEDPRKSCLQALRVRSQVENISDDNFDMWVPSGTKRAEEWSRHATWLKHRDDEVYSNTIWGTSMLMDADFNLYMDKGFNAAFKQHMGMEGEEDPGGYEGEAKEEEDEEENDNAAEEKKEGEEDEEEAEEREEASADEAADQVVDCAPLPLAEVIAATKVLAERTQRHFKFDFDYGGDVGDGVHLVAVAPVVYGGYTPDGSIVGILTSRAKHPSDVTGGEEASDDEASADEEESEEEAEGDASDDHDSEKGEGSED